MNITSFLIYCLIVTFTPGPTNLIILTTVHTFETKKAMKYIWSNCCFWFITCFFCYVEYCAYNGNTKNSNCYANNGKASFRYIVQGVFTEA